MSGEGRGVCTVSPFAASLDDAAASLAETIEAIEQAVEAAPKGAESRLARRLAGLAIAAELIHADVKRVLGQELVREDRP